MAKYNDLTVGQMEAAINMMGGWDAFQAYLRGEFAMTKISQTSTLLHLLATDITLSACSGRRTIVRAKNTFRSYIDADFKNWGLDQKSKETGETKVQVHELKKDATFLQMFKSHSADLNALCMTQDQIIEFCEQHRNHLRTEGYATFFLFKENGQFFVAHVRVYSDGLCVCVYRLEDDYVGYAGDRHRLASPQLAG